MHICTISSLLMSATIGQTIGQACYVRPVASAQYQPFWVSAILRHRALRAQAYLYIFTCWGMGDLYKSSVDTGPDKEEYNKPFVCTWIFFEDKAVKYPLGQKKFQIIPEPRGDCFKLWVIKSRSCFRHSPAFGQLFWFSRKCVLVQKVLKCIIQNTPRKGPFFVHMGVPLSCGHLITAKPIDLQIVFSKPT